MAEKLTPQQKLAVENSGGMLLVSAAAGSGKTKVLVDRLMRYLLDPAEPANIDDFLLITYTKAAAAELRGKIAAKLNQSIALQPDNRHLQKQLQRLYLTKISTVHAFCGDILREYAYQLNIPGDFRVADENECVQLRQQVLDRVLERAYESDDPLFLKFVDSQGLGRNDTQVPEIILKVYDSARCHLSPEKWLEKCVERMSPRETGDASSTIFGAFLFSRLHHWLDLQISAMERCVLLAEQTENFTKPAAVLSDTVYQLKSLRQCAQWDEIVAFGGVDFGRLDFPRKTPYTDVAERIKAVRENCKKGIAKQLKPFANESAKILADLSGCGEAAQGLIGIVREFDREFENIKRSRRILDFGDLEHKMLDLLLGKQRSGVTKMAAEIGSRFREIMVDEYQDSNEVQDAIYCALSEKKQNLFMVGDVKQSIYQFRLADPDIFLKKYADYVMAEDAVGNEGRKIMLSQNFRSGGGVLAAANDVFRNCMTPEVGGLYYGDAEALYEGISHTPLESAEAELICVDVREDTYAEEAAYVADRIRTMLDQGTQVRDGEKLRPVRAEDIVILLRSPNSCGGHFQRALEQVGVRCAFGGTNLLETEEVADLRCLLQAIHNPRLDIPLIGALTSPIFEFTADDLAQIRSGRRYGCFYDALKASAHPKAVDFQAKLLQFRNASRDHSLTGLLREIWMSTGLENVYATMEGGKQRQENLQMFFRLASEYVASGNHDLGQFLEYLSNLETKGLVTANDSAGNDAVTIMSIHKSKGLEFPVVFLCCLAREFNMESQRANVLCHKDMGLGLYAVDGVNRIRYPSIAKRAIASRIGSESVSEEMRVLYVAMTRPKDRLIMTYASNRLEKELKDMVDRMELCGKDMLIQEAVCPGEWVLLTALHKTEAGQLFALGGYPQELRTELPAWNIQVVSAPALGARQSESASENQLPQELFERMAVGNRFQYRHALAALTPSKQTATQKKGRLKDQEASENAQPIHRQINVWRKPSFADPNIRGKDYGNAVHAVMQHLDYVKCTDERSVYEQIQLLLSEGFISREQAGMTDSKQIAAFFTTEIGKKLVAGTPCIREFKFSILEDGEAYEPQLHQEKILLQGVVDCALIEEDGITILDFKTDRVTEENYGQAVENYRLQVKTYAEAMAKIYGRPVKDTLLYFFQINKTVSM